MRSALCALRSAVCGVLSPLWCFRSAVCALRSALCALRSVFCGLRSVVFGFRSAVFALRCALCGARFANLLDFVRIGLGLPKPGGVARICRSTFEEGLSTFEGGYRASGLGFRVLLFQRHYASILDTVLNPHWVVSSSSQASSVGFSSWELAIYFGQPYP